MKGTEKIIAHIDADAKAKADAVLEEAKARCEEIARSYEKKAADAYSEKIRAGVKVCEDRVEGMNRIAGMEARKNILALKQEMVSASFDKAVELLAALPRDEYVKLLARLAADASVTGDEAIVLNAADAAAVGTKVTEAANAALKAAGRPAALTLSGDNGSFRGGLVLRRSNIEVNCTVELLVELCRGEMSAELAGVLFE